MTSVNVFVQPKARAAYILSDGAITAPSGELLRTQPKILYGTGSFPYAIGLSGNVPLQIALQAFGEVSPKTLKQLEKRLPAALLRAVNLACAALQCPRSEVLLVANGVYWDFARKCPAAFYMRSLPGGVVGQEIEPFIWYEGQWFTGHHLDPSEALGRAVDLTDPGDFDPEKDGLALLEVQRRTLSIDVTPGIPAGFFRIGGEVDLTEVTKRGVRVWKIHEWPDRVGELIVP